MAHIKPFRGIRYNPERISDMASVVCPPYDVISENEQAAYHQRNPYNVVRMELGQPRPGDDDTNNHHTRAGDYLRTWLDEGILIQEDKPALYLAATDFKTADAAWTRWGLLAAVALEPFSRGGILPHERTYSNVKAERLSLMRSCPANLSPIFSFFSDQTSAIPQLRAHVARQRPAIDFTDHTQRHRLWVINDPELIASTAARLKSQPIFIADGHHRYETALAYSNEHKGGKKSGEDHPVHDTLMYLSSIQDPGLKILPAHRLLPHVASDVRRHFLNEVERYFDVHPIETRGSVGASVGALVEKLDHTLPGEGLVVTLRDIPTPLLLNLKAGQKGNLYPEELPDVLQNIDVTLLTEFVFPTFLGLTPAQLDDVHCIHYHHDPQLTLEKVRTGQYDMAFLIKPTPIAAVQRIADAGRIMPRKSTYFAPKVITGLVMHGLFDPS